MAEKTVQSDLQLVQKSQYWDAWQASKKYNVQINIFSATIDVDPSGPLRSSQIDPYVVVFLNRDRSGSKKKTTLLKKTTAPVWNECVMFTELDVSEKICLELKMPSWGSLNPVLGSITLSLHDIINLTPYDRDRKDFSLTPGLAGMTSASVSLGFAFNPPVSGKLSDEGAIPVYLNITGAFTSFLFDETISEQMALAARKQNAESGKSDLEATANARPFSSSAMKLFSNSSFESKDGQPNASSESGSARTNRVFFS